ncbi:uncharacterized protein PADG_05777 [Paracoccidioides brasiliensis Pb18]|uniref:Uncharacterized protein n=1 Tax=Paracoccidioides brasiliensis (strain Pb18) TaxID=502780 RepID=C1GEU1_PARBD|nr:uncharacterized protein PADG_05777 [Paracoccidioides brasiliensis Pb18]EEH49698.2 hypothetical protein PADG_05777 [Paracoccidioides brasiliensis Pb18]
MDKFQKAWNTLNPPPPISRLEFQRVDQCPGQTMGRRFPPKLPAARLLLQDYKSQSRLTAGETGRKIDQNFAP